MFIGEETAGGYYGNTSGSSLQLTLPHTGAQISVPLVKYVMAVARSKQLDRGVLPDHRAVPSISNVLDGKDPVMAHALELIRGG